MAPNSDVLIIGGGVIGCAVAYYLSKGGASVTLVERGDIAGEASGAAAGMLLPPLEDVHSKAFADLCQESVGLFPALVRALRNATGIDVQYTNSGFVLVAATEERALKLRRLAGDKTATGAAVEWVEGHDLRSLAPSLSPRLLGGAYSQEGWHVNPSLLTKALAEASMRWNAGIERASVTGFLRRGQRALGVRTREGRKLEADVIVIAAGAWSGFLTGKLGRPLPLRPLRGQMLAYHSTALPQIVWGEDGYLVPKRGGFLFAGATVEEVGFRPNTTATGIAHLRTMAAGLAPSLRRAEVASSWAGLRPGSPDGQPIIGWLPGWENVLLATGHSRNGVMLAPITGKLCSQLLWQGETEIALDSFGPERFLS